LIAQRHKFLVNLVLILGFTGLGFAVMGYHPGAEDDALYLSAVKIDLHPALFPHDAGFFTLQLKTTVFDMWMAAFIHRTGIPVAWAELAWQLLSMFLILFASWTIVCQLFEDVRARWAGIAMLSAMFTLPVAGTALYIVDQYLEPRAPAAALILFAVSRILSAKRWQAVPLLALAFIVHPLMGALGISFCCVLTLTMSEPFLALRSEPRNDLVSSPAAPVAAAVPFAWMFGPPSQIWLKALGSRHWFRLFQWTWYEWLGAIAPLMLFWLVARIARKQGELKLARFSMAIVFYGVFQQAIAMIILGPRALIAFSALEPMRYLHLVYVFLTLVGGAYLGRYLLKAHIWRWAVFLVLAYGGMFYAQRQLFADTEHLELPGRASANSWLQAFDWIRQNTPQDAYFALDPNYLAAPGEDYHGFRALAERSALADAIKDTSMVTKVPKLGPEWDREVQAQRGWKNFQLADFERLKSEFGVNWTLVSNPPPQGLACRWHNGSLAVCQIP
jgi:hypothetical protein